MKIGIAQINTTVGALERNAQVILDAYQELCRQGADLVLTPELAITGYPPRDLLLRERFLADALCQLNKLAKTTGSVPLLIGLPIRCETSLGWAFNAAAWCENGTTQQYFHKTLLPTYDVFDEARYFHPGNAKKTRIFQGKTIGVTICEDLWHAHSPDLYGGQKDPMVSLAAENPDLILNLSASPWHFGKSGLREKIISEAAKKGRCPVVYANSVGGNDELIFDGRSSYALRDNKVYAAAPAFQGTHALIDLKSENHTPIEKTSVSPMDEVEAALVLGLRDYAWKSGFRKAVIGLSGGIDSAVTAALAVLAFGKENVRGIALPSSISSEHSRSDARALAENLGIEFDELKISPIVQAATTTLAPLFKGTDVNVAEENIQARTRGLVLMAISNKFGELLLTTGNKSEVAVGYCTLYGDMAGGLAVLSDVPKTMVYDLARHMNRRGETIPKSTITKPPSAELRPDQKDEDSLPPYSVLDEILEMYVEKGYSREKICQQGFAKEMVYDVLKKVDQNEYKRKQAAPGLKITPLAFGIGRRIPIVQHYVH